MSSTNTVKHEAAVPADKSSKNLSVPEPGLASVIIPCYNQAHFLGEAIESAIAQTYGNREIIVVDDGSTDHTPQVVARYAGVRYIHQQNSGLSSARNTGIQSSHGEYIVFLDADDRLLPRALEVGVNYLLHHPECAFVSGHCRVFAADGSVFDPAPQPSVERDHYLELLRGNYIWCPANVVYRRQIFEAVGGFDTSINPAADYDLYLRITRHFPVLAHSELVADYRRHISSMSADTLTMQRATIAVHDAQEKFVPAMGRHRDAFEFGKKYWRKHYDYWLMITRIREVVHVLPKNTTVLVMSRGQKELLRLHGRRAWHFPQSNDDSFGRLFQQGSDGTAKATWIEAGLVYEFRLCSAGNGEKLLAELLVTGISGEIQPLAVNKPETGPYLIANPNPVHVTLGLGTTTIAWSTSDGSNGRVLVCVGGTSGRDPVDAVEAVASLETLRRRGAEYFLIPASAFDWLDSCSGFKHYLERCHRAILTDSSCIIYDLSQREGPRR
jgi:glycosyltransferase involved in cell wall biosynthesis